MKLHFTVEVATFVEIILPTFFILRGYKADIHKVISKNDVAALTISLISMVVLAWSGLHGGPILQQLIRQSTTGYDGVQHMSLTLSLYNNKGYMYGEFSKLENKILFNNLPSYPQGWSLSTSLWWHSISNNLNIKTHPTQVLFLYFTFLVLWFGALIYAFCTLTLNLIEAISKRRNSSVELFGGVLFTALVEIMVLIGVPYNSFVSFYPALIFPLVLAILITELFCNKFDEQRAREFLVSGMLLSGGVAFSWLLAAPAPYVMVLMSLLSYFSGNLRAAIKWLFRDKIILIISILLLLLASGQGWVQLLYGVKGLVNYTGGAGMLYNLVLFSFLIMSTLAAFISNDERIKNIYTSSVAGIFIMCGLVYLYQFATVGQANYFSTKITFIAFTLLTAFAAAFIISAICTNLAKNSGYLVKVLLLTAIAIFIPVSSNMDLSTSNKNGIGLINFMQGKRFLSEYSASQISNLMTTKQIYKANFVMYKHLNYAEDVTTTHFIQMLSQRAIPRCDDTILGELISEWSLHPKTVINCAKGREFYVISSSLDYSKLNQEFATAKNVHVILSN